MKVVYISNALDHIQIPLCDAWHRLTDGEFTYVAAAQSSAIRTNITAEDINKSREYVLRPYESCEQEALAMQAIDDADVAILGTAPERYIHRRLRNNQLTFRYMERLYKEPFTLRNAPRRIVSAFLHHSRFQRRPLRMLCAGAYAAADHELFGNYRNKRYTWGYFPALLPVDIDGLFQSKQTNDTVEIIWVGRFVGLKHPEQVVLLGEHLKEKGLDFHINMVGYGELEESCAAMVEQRGLRQQIDVLGATPPEQVRQLMDRANILLFTSDRGEGWGAVVNEGMNSGCAVVASAQAGVSPYLVRHEENGLLYDVSSQQSLNAKVEKLIIDSRYRQRLARQGYETVFALWNPENAARSFLELVQSIEKGKPNPVLEGPCSDAPLLKDGWFCE